MQEKILSIMRHKGPVLPKDIGRQLGLDSTFAGAHLSELALQKKIVVSHLKVGASPVYYLSGQKERLQELAGNLKMVEQEAYSLLKAKGILPDADMEPAHRVALRTIKDFALPLTVAVKDSKLLFWRWYMLSDEEVKLKLQEILAAKEMPAANGRETGPFQHSPSSSPIHSNPPAHSIPPPTIPSSEKFQQTNGEIRALQQALSRERENLGHAQSSWQKAQAKYEFAIAESEKVIGQLRAHLSENSMMLDKLRKENDSLRNENTVLRKNSPASQQEDPGEFYGQIRSYFEKSSISPVSYEIVRKNTEFDFVVQFTSAVGALKYYCKVKRKKRYSDKDIAEVIEQGRQRNLPAMLVATGELTKKAQALADHIIVKQMD